VKVLAASDVHAAPARISALVAASREADLFLGAGDFCNMRRGLDGVMAAFTGLACPAVLVPGNAESAEELRAAAPWATVLHGRETEAAGLRIFGLGGGVPPTPFGAWSWDVPEAEAEALLAPLDGHDVLLLHSPPKGVADRTAAGESVGSPAIRAAIERGRPGLALCGHIHDSWGATGRVGETGVRNLGPRPVWLDL